MAHVADAHASLVGLKTAEDRNRAEAGSQQPGQNAQQSGFACAVLADEDVATARFEVCRDLAERSEGAEEL